MVWEIFSFQRLQKSQIYSFMPVISQKELSVCEGKRFFFHKTVHYDVHKLKLLSE